MKLWNYLLVLLLGVSVGNSARILCVYPFPSISHQVVFRALTVELARLGHELVVITPDPAFKDKPHPNVTEIDTHHTHGLLKKIFEMFKPKLGVVVPTEDLVKAPKSIAVLIALYLQDTNVTSLLEDKSQKFDLVIGESMFYFPLRIAKMYDAPAIWFSSFYGTTRNYEVMGAPARHPEIYPSYMRYQHYDLTIWDRIWGIYNEIQIYTNYFMKTVREEIEILNQYFGNVVSEEELMEIAKVLLVNVNPIFDGNRPVPPNIVYLGGLHMKPRQPLPKDLQTYLDSSSRGVIYVSLGTNVQTNFMDPTLLDQFLKAFEVLPYDIIWKFVGELPWQPKNLKIGEWFPQRDLLMHPNIKAFIMQGGLQSTDEAVDAGVPLVGIPMLADQGYNLDHYVRLGIGVKLDPLTLTAEKLVKAVHKVIEDKTYRENIRALTPVFRAHSASALQRAVSAVDMVLQTGGRHLQPSTAGMTWTTYLMLDVVALLAAFLIVSLGTLYYAVIFLRKFTTNQNTNVKLKLN